MISYNPNSPEWLRLQRLAREWAQGKHYAQIDGEWAGLLEEMGTNPRAFFAAISDRPIREAGGWSGAMRYGSRDCRRIAHESRVPLALTV